MEVVKRYIMDIKVPQDELTLKKPELRVIDKLINVFKAPPDAAALENPELIRKSYAYWRLRIFLALFFGYIVFYLCRKNISVALPSIGIALNYTNTQLGLLGSTLYLTYAIGKFTNGVLADRANIRTFLPAALIISAIANICFVLSCIFITPGKFTFFGLPSASILLWLLAFFWGCNGWFQSMGFPPIAKGLTYWYSNSERGLKWSLWSTSHEVGTFLSIIISGYLIAHYGWKAAFYVPAIFAILVSFILFDRLRDKPASVGLPDIEEYREPACTNKTINDDDDNNDSYFEIFKKYILCNKMLWMLAFAYIFVYIIRYGTVDWIIKYLIEVKQDSLEIAAIKLSFLPLFGIIGTISAGYISDKIFKGRRAPVNIIFLIGIILSILALKYNSTSTNFVDSLFLSVTNINLKDVIPINGSGILDFIYLGLIGIFTCGPQVLIGGLCAVESSSKKVASAATGFTGSFGYLGAILSGAGTGFAIDKFGWDGAIYFWLFSAFICILICLPMWNYRSSCK